MSNNKRHYQSVALFIVIVIFISSILYNFSSIRSSWQHLSSGDNNSVATLSVDDGWYRSTDDAYQYPISPYTTPDIWKTYTTVMQKWEAIQIPTDILHSMSTAGLIESCINCPFYAYYINFMDNYYTGIKIVEDQFNGLQELYKREDAAIEFVKFYQTVNVEKLYNQHEYPQFQLSFIEFIMSNNNIINQMTEDERAVILNSVLSNVHLRDGVYRFDMEDVSKAILLGRVLRLSSSEFEDRLKENIEIRMFVEKGNRNIGNSIIDSREFIRSMETYIGSK